MDLETQKNRVSHLSGEIKALKIARNYIDSAIKSKAGNLQSMREATARMKVVSKGKERYEDYKERVKIIKKAIAVSNEQAIKEKINEMELRGKI